MSDEQTITIDGKDYNVGDLSDAVKAQLISLRAADQEIARLQALMAITQTARKAYAAAIKQELEGKSGDDGEA